jgi:branched-subunit amino acid aminotransferase/4-amino-4-deoxychorismate lyase
MERSLRELGMPMPIGRAALKLVTREMVAKNRMPNGFPLSAGDARRGEARSRSPGGRPAPDPDHDHAAAGCGGA